MPVGCGFFAAPPSFPSRATPRHCVLRPAAGVPCGVVAAVAGPRSWRTGGCAGGWGGRLTVPISLPIPPQVVGHMPRRVSVRGRPQCSSPSVCRPWALRAPSRPPTPPPPRRRRGGVNWRSGGGAGGAASPATPPWRPGSWLWAGRRRSGRRGAPAADRSPRRACTRRLHTNERRRGRGGGPQTRPTRGGGGEGRGALEGKGPRR